jgi:hypothetical protein
MKRTGGAALVAAACLALALSGTALARNPHAGTHGQGHGPSAHVHGNAHAQGHGGGSGTNAKNTIADVPVLTELWVKGGASHPDGIMHVLALVQAPLASRPDTLDVVVHFASGDLALTLARNGNGHGVAYHGDAAVPTGEPTGEVAIDVAGDVGSQALTGTGWGKVLAGGDGTDAAPGDQTTEDATDGTDAAPGEQTTEDATDGTDTGDAQDAGDAQGAEDGSQGDGVVLSSDFIRQVIALLESLLA